MDQQNRPKRYITTLAFYHEGDNAGTLEEAVTQSREVISCAEDHGLTLIDGNTSRSREREAVESWTFGSEKSFRNLHAEVEERGEVWDREAGMPRAFAGAGSPSAA